MNARSRTIIALLTALALLAASCGSAEDASNEAGTEDSGAEVESIEEATGVRLVSAEAGADIASNAPDDLVILDVRTPEEFAQGHLDGAMMIDFYDEDFAQQIAQLDPDVPYLVYCASGARSGQASLLMDALNFTNVADIDGGITSWDAAGLPIVNP